MDAAGAAFSVCLTWRVYVNEGDLERFVVLSISSL